jgi:hypothetical protein
MNLQESIGLDKTSLSKSDRKRLQLYINLKLASTGQPIANAGDEEFMETAQDLLKSYNEKNRLLSGHLCPVDKRIQVFLDRYLADCVGKTPRLPGNSLILDRYGLARELSLPSDGDIFKSDIVTSYRTRQGVLNNPANDRRTTKGSFHIAEGGLPIQGDKLRVPKLAYQNLLSAALNAPDNLLAIPFTANQEKQAKLFVSLLLRPVVVPEVPGTSPAKNMEIRFFAPGNLVSNLDFVESIFGNGGNPMLPEHDAGLDIDHWTGHTGCVILAPHLVYLSKKSLGLPNVSEATDQQIRDGMCWSDDSEKYNDGNAFKITARDASGVMVTIIADNYYGYCKKEVKTQIGFAANLNGLAEEEHAGGALAFARRSHAEEYGVDSRTRQDSRTFKQMCEQFSTQIDIQPEGYAIDRNYPNLIYVPRDIRMRISGQTIRWKSGAEVREIRLQPGKVYMQPSGYKIEMEKHPDAPTWRLIGTDAEGVFCHKPSTVSGGGKSEISKSLDDAIIYGPIFVNDLEQDLDAVEEIFKYDYTRRLKPEFTNEDRAPTRQPLSPDRSLGSVIKLLTPSTSNTVEYNQWLTDIPARILSLIFIIKRIHQTEWGDDWRRHYTVDIINGEPGHALKANNRELVLSYLRVGLDAKGEWHTYKLRQDFIACEKVQMEDDITASIVVPTASLPNTSPKYVSDSVKLTHNCEYRLFQRPDDAVYRGFDKQSEFDMAQPGTFMANYEPLQGEALENVVEDVVSFQSYTTPMRKLLKGAYKEGNIVVSSAHPRLINGEPSKNPRYLQLRPDLQKPFRKYVAHMGARLNRKLAPNATVVQPVDAVLTGRRNNPAEPGIRALAVYNPIHYQELPELFMDFISSLTGKSPSTTGTGSEGALTKGPFNALRTTSDLNNALVSFILTGYDGFSSAAGYVGPNLRVDHDISLLIPEIWARLDHEQRSAASLIKSGYLEKLEDFDFEGETILASRLGYRITERFVTSYMGKIFDSPAVVFDEALLKPEQQDMTMYVDGIKNIVETQQSVAQRYITDGSIESACPPLQALIQIMATGSYEGKNIQHPDIRSMFSKTVLVASKWYERRLKTQQSRDIMLWRRHIEALTNFLQDDNHTDIAETMGITGKLKYAESRLKTIKSPNYIASLNGTIGADPI